MIDEYLTPLAVYLHAEQQLIKLQNAMDELWLSLSDEEHEYLNTRKTDKQRLLWIGEWTENVFPNAPRALSVPLDEKPKRVWTLYGHVDEKRPPSLPFTPVHRGGAFLEDYVHDWNWHAGKFVYYSRVTNSPVWLLLEYM